MKKRFMNKRNKAEECTPMDVYHICSTAKAACVNINKTGKRLTYGGDLYARLAQLQEQKLEYTETMNGLMHLQEECMAQLDIINKEMDEMLEALQMVPEDLLKEMYSLRLSFQDRAKLLVLNDRMDAANRFCDTLDELIESLEEGEESDGGTE